jgi:uncharacterized protein YecT (DUF1311 family)
MTGLSIASVSAFADNCDNARNTFDEFYCKDKLYIQADKDLNTAYGELMRALPNASKKTLKSVQLEWMRGRDSQCIEERDDEIVLFVNCRLNKTIEQTNFLQDRLRECKSTGCQPSRLTN